MSNEQHYQVALTFLPMVGAVTARNLVSYCGGAEAVFRTPKKDLLKIPGIGPATASVIASAEPLQLAEKEIHFMEQHDIEAVFYTDDHFPVRLRQLADSPALLYFKGSSLDLLNKERTLAIVGTRKPTDYGKMLCEEFTERLKDYNVTLISGLAYGIDVAAHKKAVAQNMPNIGVLGHGLGRIYPESHRTVAMKMTENGGLISEYPHQTPPDRENFPMRNRIIAGMCDGLLVVETADSGGSMISAQLAYMYGREVFAVPGRVRDPNSAGCNLLIKTDRAKLVESAEEIAESLNWPKNGTAKSVQRQLFLDLSPLEETVVEAVRQKPEIQIDELTYSTRMNPGELASMLLKLEFQGVLRTLPGRRYVLVG